MSPYLDRALEMPDGEREAWLADVAAHDPALAAELRSLLDRRRALDAQGFLERGPQLPPWISKPGQTIGAYRLLSQIGRGGMGSVWLAERSDGRFTGVAAVKILNASVMGAVGHKRFTREGSILARLKHPHIAHLVDAGVSTSGQPYLVLEHVDGEQIDRYCDARKLGVEARVRLFLDVMAAVAHAHASLIVHRDIKPSNVLVGSDGRVKLLDFGIAKLMENDGGAGELAALTGEGGPAMTPEYAAPEQLTGGVVTTATDVYALGVLLYVLLTGEHPVGAARRSPADLVDAIVSVDPPRASAIAAREEGAAASRGTTADRLRRALRGDLDTILVKALKKDPEERYASVAAMADDLKRMLAHEPIGARPDTLAYRTTRFAQRNRLAFGLTAATVAALLAGLGGTLWQAREARRQRDLALAQLARSNSVNEFMSFLLGEGAPVGKTMTVRELLGLAETYVDKRFARNDALAVELLALIGNIYDARDETDNAERTTKRAYEASLRLADPAVRATAACERALAVARQGRYADAQRLFDEGLGLLTGDARFDAIASACLTYKASTAANEGDGELAVRTAQQALDRLRFNPDAYPNHRCLALDALASGHLKRGEEAAADHAYAAAMQERERAGLTDPMSLAHLLHGWAAVRSTSNVIEALAMQQRSNRLWEGMPTIAGLLREGWFLYQLARYAEAAAADHHAMELADQHANGVFSCSARLDLAGAYRAAGDEGRAEAMLREAETRLASYPSTHFLRTALSAERGLLALTRGDLAAARGPLLDSLHELDSTGPHRTTRMETLLALSDLELRSGDLTQATAYAEASLAQAEHLRGDFQHSAWSGRSRLALARIAAARGDRGSADRLAASALEDVTPTLGASHPAALAARTWLAERRFGGVTREPIRSSR